MWLSKKVEATEIRGDSLRITPGPRTRPRPRARVENFYDLEALVVTGVVTTLLESL